MTKVKLTTTDTTPPQSKEFDIEHAQRIFEIKIANKGWKLDDDRFEMVKGKITAKA